MVNFEMDSDERDVVMDGDWRGLFKTKQTEDGECACERERGDLQRARERGRWMRSS